MPKSVRQQLAESGILPLSQKTANDSTPPAHDGSFNNPTPIAKTKSKSKTKKQKNADKRKGKNEYDLYLAFNQVSGSNPALVIGSRRLHRYYNSSLKNTDHPPSNKGASIPLRRMADIDKNPFDLRMEAIKKIIHISGCSDKATDESPSGTQRKHKSKQKKAFVKENDKLTIYTTDPQLHEMLAGTNPLATEALAEFNKIADSISISIKSPEKGSEHLASATDTMQQHANELETKKQNYKGKQNHRPTPTAHRYG